MIDGSEKRNRQLAFELQNSHACEKRSNWPNAQHRFLTRFAAMLQNTWHVFVACFTEALRDILKAQLLDGWKTLSTVQWRKQFVFQLIRCLVFYSVDSALQRLNNRGREYCYCIEIVNMTRNKSRA